VRHPDVYCIISQLKKLKIEVIFSNHITVFLYCQPTEQINKNIDKIYIYCPITGKRLSKSDTDVKSIILKKYYLPDFQYFTIVASSWDIRIIIKRYSEENIICNIS
jgi:hypothetical protein